MDKSKSKFSYQSLVRVLEKEYQASLPSVIKVIFKEVYKHCQGHFRDAVSAENRLPVIVHPVGTARLAIKYYPKVKNIPDNLETVVCLALVHDLLEDTRIDGSLIEALAGTKVLSYAEVLTKPPSGIAGKSSEERNREFLEQIIEGGITPAFIKICDSMHNLSYPAATPLHILRKLIDKTENQYSLLLNKYPLGWELKADYLSVLSKAKENLKVRLVLEPESTEFTLESAIAECIETSNGKILELHDICEVLSRILKTGDVAIWHYTKDKEGGLGRVVVAKEKSKLNSVKITEIFETPQNFTGNVVSKLGLSLNCSTLYFVPMKVDPEVNLMVMVAFTAKNKPPKWLSLHSLTMLVHFLSHRLIVFEADRKSRLALAAANAGIRLDAQLAARVGVHPAQLSQLEHWRSHCQQATTIVTYLLNQFLMSEETKIPLKSLVKIESRVKTIDSILRKHLRYGENIWPEFEKLEDIAGVRVICPTKAGTQMIEKFLLSKRAVDIGVNIHSSFKEPKRDYVKNPTKSGYRAIHLILEIQTYLGDKDAQVVPCEVQLRTMFQNTWAEISHVTAYEDSSNGHNDYNRALKEMGKVLERCEELAEKLIDKEQ